MSKEKAKKNNNKRNFIANNIYMLKLIAKISPLRVAATFFNTFAVFFSRLFFNIFFLENLVDAIQGEKGFYDIVIFVTIFMGVFLLIQLYQSWYYNRYLSLSDLKITKEMNMLLYKKVLEVDISCFENKDFYDKYTVAASEASSRAITTLDNVSNIITAFISFGYLIGYMTSLDYLAPLFIIIPVATTLITNKLINKYEHAHYLANVPFVRRIDCVNREFFLKKYSKDIRLSNVKNVLFDQYDEAVDGLYKNVDTFRRRKFASYITRTLICYPLTMQGAWAYISYKVISSETLGSGDFVVLANALINSTTMILDALNSVNESVAGSLYIDNFRDFMEYKPIIDENQKGLPVPENPVFEFKNVSFTYFGQEEPVIKDVSFTIPAHKKVALVGHNGAGKSTLIKLLMRFYDPIEGEILMNGVNIKEYDLQEYRKMFGTVFQDYQIYAFSLKENVLMDVYKPEDEERCRDAIAKSSLTEKVDFLPEKADSILLREYDENGVILSGGEFQKVAISRVFASNSKMMILDEPSSALDPIAEHEMYKTLSKTYTEGNGKSVLMISHRLSMAVSADMVILLSGGRIVEQGTHNELMALKGEYYDLFEHQARNYV